MIDNNLRLAVSVVMFLVTIGCVIASWFGIVPGAAATQSAYILVVYIIGFVFFWYKKENC